MNLEKQVIQADQDVYVYRFKEWFIYMVVMVMMDPNSTITLLRN